MLTLFKRISLWMALLGIVIVIFMVYKTTTIEEVQPPPSAPAQKPAERVIAAAGMVEALRENTNIGVPVPGLVKTMLVEVWDKVEINAPLLQLDDRELQAQLLTQKADLKVREAEILKAKRQAELTESLQQKRVISRDEAKSRSEEYAIAKAQADTVRAKIEQTEELIERLTVRAPIAGTVLQVNTRAGEYLMPGASPAPVLLGSIDELQVRADVDEQLAPRLKPGSKAVGYLKGDTSHPIDMEFVRVEPYIIPKRNLTGSSSERVDTRILQVIYSFQNNEKNSIYVGQQMDIYIQE